MKSLIRVFLALAMFATAPLRAFTVAEMKEMEAKVRKLVATNTPAVVSLLGDSSPGAGSGTIVSEDGIILTAAHVTRGNERMTVVFPDGSTVKCKVLGSNYTRDIGLAKIEGGGKFPFVEMGDSDKLEPTTIVVAMGHPGGFDIRRTPPVRIGRISATNMGGFLVSDCTLVGGDSGGPLFDLDGRVVGVHSSISESLAFNRDAPVSAAKTDWERLMKGERWGRLRGDSEGDDQRAVLGAVLDPETKDGVGLKQIEPKSPAAEAGLKAGDIIVKLEGEALKDIAALRDRLRKSKPGDKLALTYLRGGAENTVTVTLISEAALLKKQEPPDERARPRRGRNRNAPGNPGQN